ncbi:hypothetical protein [Ferruginivarius sediminum]|uniref:Lipoprotein n=1 Tax=Ferruginivarius sediminum TaxID=2661937 RepID=A0A369TBZ1_9PROT|nr:hypothetical protein [Ferruginivarius sediminum]RDD62829.1 hypothetical protein DRB17_06640 [Ferruginivarius sediminum]
MRGWQKSVSRFAVLLAFASLATASACTYSGRVDDPVSRKLTWFSFLNGDDIRKRCGTSASEWEVRLVYNGNYEKQLRSYHIVSDGSGGAFVSAQATPDDYGSVTVLSVSDPLAAVRWKTSQTRISPDARATLEAKLRDSGLYEKAPSGLRLPSWGWYWTATVCKDGQVFYNAWLYPSKRWEKQNFRDILLAYDDTGVAFTKPIPAAEARVSQRSQYDEKGSRIRFNLQVGENGLKGTTQLF